MRKIYWLILLLTLPAAAGAAGEYDDFSGAGSQTRQYCTEQWPDDYSMEQFCRQQQNKAVDKLKEGGPRDMSFKVFERIREHCGRQWPDDYTMRAFCEEQQIKAWRKLNQ